jgi:hypothetical protein
LGEIENSLSRAQSMACTPEKNCLVNEAVLDSGEMILSWPQAYKPFFRRIRRMTGKKEETFIRKIQLDELGCQVWAMIDGKTDVASIVNAFARHHKIHRREAEISVTLFIKSLGEKGLIGLRLPD